MSDIAQRLRDQGTDAFAKHYSLGMFKLCAEAADEIDLLREALRLCKQDLTTAFRHVERELAFSEAGRPPCPDVGTSRGPHE